MFWDSSIGIIKITLDAFPSTWGNWTMYLDGEEMPMEGGPGNPVIRPNAPLEQPPTGLIIGTEPWVTGLADVDFPCCGTIQFDIPGEGLTNEYEFNLVDFGCETASEKECPSEWIKHYGDLVIEGAETKIIENIKYFQHGNIYVNDEARLVIRNSQLMMGRGEVPTIHTYIFVSEEASLEIENSLIFPQPGSGLVCVFNHGTVSITDSPTSIHYFDMSEGAQLTMMNSEMVYTIGGLLQVTGGDTILIDSTIGALGLKVPANAHLDISGLESGAYFESWDVHEMIPEADYNLVLERTCILKDDFTGELEHGPYERGWLFFLDPNAHVRISDSELRKVFIDLINENVGFENLRVGIPSSLNYRDIELTDVIIMGQWPFTIIDSNVTIRDSDYLFLQPSGQSTITLVNSHMCEFIPRDFFGTMIFENGIWTEAGEIIGGVPYHSMENDFTIKGSLKIEGVRENLQWKDAQVTREYDVIVKNGNGNPIEGALIKIDGKTFISDDAGQAKFNLIFNEFNYIETKELEVLGGENLITQKEIDFFTETPIRIGADSPADFTLILTSEIGGTTDPAPGTYVYNEGTKVTIRAVPDTHYEFNGWVGHVPHAREKDNPITITMDSDKSIEANFIRQYTLILEVLVTCGGTGGTTDPEPGTCTYDKGTEVQIEAIPDTNYRFTNWSGDVSSIDNPITITMDGDKLVTANFIRQYTLTIASSSGGSIDPSPGTYTYDCGIEVTIKATPGSGYEFSGWSGDASGTTNPITIKMDSNKSIKANFSTIVEEKEEKKGPCFIATAAYSSPLHPYVEILGDFRDKYLMPSMLGRKFVNLYYKYSPLIADLIAKNKVLKAGIRISLLPLVAFSYLIVHFGPLITAVILGFIFVLPIFLISFCRRKLSE